MDIPVLIRLILYMYSINTVSPILPYIKIPLYLHASQASIQTDNYQIKYIIGLGLGKEREQA